MPRTTFPAAAEGLPKPNRMFADIPILAEAGGVFFLTIANGDRSSLAFAIERMINLLDAMEPDPDLEPWLGKGDDREGENEHGGDILDEPHDDCDQGDTEPFLGWPETCSQGWDEWARTKQFVQGIDPDGSEGMPMRGVPLDFRRDGYRQARDALRNMMRGRRSKRIYTERAQFMPDGTIMRTLAVVWEARP